MLRYDVTLGKNVDISLLTLPGDTEYTTDTAEMHINVTKLGNTIGKEACKAYALNIVRVVGAKAKELGLESDIPAQDPPWRRGYKTQRADVECIDESDTQGVYVTFHPSEHKMHDDTLMNLKTAYLRSLSELDITEAEKNQINVNNAKPLIDAYFKNLRKNFSLKIRKNNKR